MDGREHMAGCRAFPSLSLSLFLTDTSLIELELTDRLKKKGGGSRGHVHVDVHLWPVRRDAHELRHPADRGVRGHLQCRAAFCVHLRYGACVWWPHQPYHHVDHHMVRAVSCCSRYGEAAASRSSTPATNTTTTQECCISYSRPSGAHSEAGCCEAHGDTKGPSRESFHKEF